MGQTLIQLGGMPDAPPLHLAPANGFPPQVYAPMMAALKSPFRHFSFPPRPLWDDAPPPPTDFGDWTEAADDLVSAFERHNLRDILLIGHSMGALVSLMVANRQPSRFRGLVMLDPVILPREILLMIQDAAARKALDEMPQAQSALRRRRTFESREAAFERFRSRSSFADWSDDALWLYVEHGLLPKRDAAGFELAWSADWEVYYFATIQASIWDDLAALDSALPTLIVRGSGSYTFSPDMMRQVQATAPSADTVDFDGQGHLFPQAAPTETAALIQRWLDDTGA